MYKRIFFIAGIILMASQTLHAQLNPALNVQHYQFQINLNDTNNIIAATATINIQFVQTVNEVKLDLVKKRADGKGMIVTAVAVNDKNLPFIQEANALVIKDAAAQNEIKEYTITYNGIPADGLIISTSKFGKRTFFADHWPNRAHNWLPCNDHLLDKATVEFDVTAPDHYQVVANGLKIEETNLPEHKKLTRWREDVPLSTKVMTIGVADFAVNYVADINCVPVYSYVYPQQRDSGFASYAIAQNILPWYIQHVGPYAYKKLANVQSKTIFGGLENANTIFYYENSVQSPGIEGLMVHEIAHQWFGNSATEKDWPHLWLSEGFATYMTNLYHEDKYGIDSFNHRMRTDRDSIIAFSTERNTPVVDTTASNNLMELLNRNSYEKGSWVLHMLRRKLGDNLFWKSVQTYYATYAGKNADTHDLQQVFEQVSNQNLDTFFQQWLFTPGQPKLNVTWSFDKRKSATTLVITQLQKMLFNFPLDVLFTNGTQSQLKTFQINDRTTTLNIALDFQPQQIQLDPNLSLLFQATLKKL